MLSSTAIAEVSRPSAPIRLLLDSVAQARLRSTGMKAMMERESEFTNPTQAKLTGIALDPLGREFAEETLDGYWSDIVLQRRALEFGGPGREVIIGSGFHTAVYAAIRVLSGYPKPLVLERNDRVGGVFAVTARPTFYLNSRNRPGQLGLAGDTM